MNEVLSADEVAALLDCTPQQVAEKTREGELPGVKFGRSWRYPREALIKRLNELALRSATRPEPVAVVREVPKRRPPVLPGVV